MSESIATATRHLVFRVAKLGRSPRLILDAIADRADAAGRAWPSERLLAESTDMSVRGVRDAVRELEERGILKITRRGWHQSNIYDIQLRVLAALPRIGGDQTGNGCRPDAERPANLEGQTGKNRQTDRQPLPPKLPREGHREGSTPLPPTGGARVTPGDLLGSRTGGRAIETGRNNGHGGRAANSVIIRRCHGRGQPLGDVSRNGNHGHDASETEDPLVWLDCFNRLMGTDLCGDDPGNLRAITRTIGKGLYTLADADCVVSWAATTWRDAPRLPSTIFGPKFGQYLAEAKRPKRGVGDAGRVNEKWGQPRPTLVVQRDDA